MPTYTFTPARGLLNTGQKSAVAAGITGAPAYFAQVIFQDVNEGDHFVGGLPLGHDHLFVYACIRGSDVFRLGLFAGAAASHHGRIWPHPSGAG